MSAKPYARLYYGYLAFECPECRCVEAVKVFGSMDDVGPFSDGPDRTLKFPAIVPCSVCGSKIELSVGVRTVEASIVPDTGIDTSDVDTTVDGTLVDNLTDR